MENLGVNKKKIEINIIFIWSESDGKTSIIEWNINNSFKENYLSTFAIDVKSKKVEMEDGIKFKVKIYDTDDQECFRSITWIYIKQADGVIIIYDITQSFYGVGDWINRIKNDSSYSRK